MKQIITRTINWHSIAKEGLPKVNGDYVVKKKHNFWINSAEDFCRFSVDPIEVNPKEINAEDDDYVTETRENVFYVEDDDEWSIYSGYYFTVGDSPYSGPVTHWANVETDCMETIDFVD